MAKKIPPETPINDENLEKFAKMTYQGCLNYLKDFLRSDEIQLVLQSAGDEKASRLYALLSDPVHAKTPMYKLCKSAGMTLGDLVDHIRKFGVDLGILQAARAMPKIVLENAIDADAKYHTCEKCNGTGQDTVAHRVCTRCHGQKYIRIPGNIKAREQIYNITGAIKKADPNPAVNLAQQFNIGDSVAMVKDLEKLTS